MDWNPNKPKVPVDKDGNWLSYPDHWMTHAWEEVTPFFAVMSISKLHSGRSAKHLILEDTATGKTYPMFIGDLVKGIKNCTLRVSEGNLSAIWTGSKMGTNYGIRSIK